MYCYFKYLSIMINMPPEIMMANIMSISVVINTVYSSFVKILRVYDTMIICVHYVIIN